MIYNHGKTDLRQILYLIRNCRNSLVRWQIKEINFLEREQFEASLDSALLQFSRHVSRHHSRSGCISTWDDYTAVPNHWSGCPGEMCVLLGPMRWASCQRKDVIAVSDRFRRHDWVTEHLDYICIQLDMVGCLNRVKHETSTNYILTCEYGCLGVFFCTNFLFCRMKQLRNISFAHLNCSILWKRISSFGRFYK